MPAVIGRRVRKRREAVVRQPRGAGQATPETDGRAILQRTCQQCHDLATATTKLASEDWTAVIGRT